MFGPRLKNKVPAQHLFKHNSQSFPTHTPPRHNSPTPVPLPAPAPPYVCVDFSCILIFMTASQAKEVFHVEWIKPEKKDVDTVAAVDRADDDDGGQAVKRQRIGDNVVKEEDKEDESLDLQIGNMAGGGDNLNGTSDALAVFERSWREDSETVCLLVLVDALRVDAIG